MTAEQFDDLAKWWLEQKYKTNKVACLDLARCNFCSEKPLCPVCAKWSFEDDQYHNASHEARMLRCLVTDSSTS